MTPSRAADALGCSASLIAATFSQPGSYPYHCVYHRFMEANVIVR
jgi:plastocyanin